MWGRSRRSSSPHYWRLPTCRWRTRRSKSPQLVSSSSPLSSRRYTCPQRAWCRAAERRAFMRRSDRIAANRAVIGAGVSGELRFPDAAPATSSYQVRLGLAALRMATPRGPSGRTSTRAVAGGRGTPEGRSSTARRSSSVTQAHLRCSGYAEPAASVRRYGLGAPRVRDVGSRALRLGSRVHRRPSPRRP